MASVALRNIIATFTVGLTLALSVSAAAQFYSEGYEFLEAVRERNGTEATDMLNEPGTTVINSRDIGSGETGLHIVVARRDRVDGRKAGYGGVCIHAPADIEDIEQFN